jgi:hypothetical protein
VNKELTVREGRRKMLIEEPGEEGWPCSQVPTGQAEGIESHCVRNRN